MHHDICQGVMHKNVFFFFLLYLYWILLTFLLAPNSEYGLWNSSGFVKDSLLMTDDGFLGHTPAMNSRLQHSRMESRQVKITISRLLEGRMITFSCSTIPFQRCDQPFFKFVSLTVGFRMCFFFQKCLVLSIRIGIKIWPFFILDFIHTINSWILPVW